MPSIIRSSARTIESAKPIQASMHSSWHTEFDKRAELRDQLSLSGVCARNLPGLAAISVSIATLRQWAGASEEGSMNLSAQLTAKPSRF